MRNLLQYAYSILVFFGVLSTAYMAMDREGNARVPLRSLQTPPLRAEANMIDPAVTQLFQMEDALSRLDASQTAPNEVRRPSRIEIILPSQP